MSAVAVAVHVAGSPGAVPTRRGPVDLGPAPVSDGAGSGRPESGGATAWACPASPSPTDPPHAAYPPPAVLVEAGVSIAAMVSCRALERHCAL